MTISVQLDLDSSAFQLFATDRHSTAIAGERLFRGYPRPDVQFSHTSEAAARKDAATLQDYLLNPPKKGRAKATAQDMANAVWNL